MNIPRYATLAARLLRRQASQLANPPGPAEMDRGIEAIERALVARRRRRARSMLVLVLVLVGMAVLGLIGTMAGAVAGSAPGSGCSLIEHAEAHGAAAPPLRASARFLISATVAASSANTLTAKPLPVEVTLAFAPFGTSGQ